MCGHVAAKFDRTGVHMRSVSEAFWGRAQPVRMCAILLRRFQIGVIVKRIGLANTYRGGIFMTTLILIAGHSTPRLSDGLPDDSHAIRELER